MRILILFGNRPEGFDGFFVVLLLLLFWLGFSEVFFLLFLFCFVFSIVISVYLSV